MTTDAGTWATLKPDPHVIVLFGATGDLAKRKLLPGLYHLYVAGLMPPEFRIIGTSPDTWSAPTSSTTSTTPCSSSDAGR